jgi:hypothetical protein
MTVKRVALKSFALFPNLPAELQQMVWQFALQAPRLITLGQTPDEDEHYVASNIHCPTLLSVCHASRQLVLKISFQTLPMLQSSSNLLFSHKVEYEFYNPLADTVRLNLNIYRDPKKFCKYKIKSLGIPFEPQATRSWEFTARHAKTFVGLEEVVVLVAIRGKGYQMRPLPVPEDSAILIGRYSKTRPDYGPRQYVLSLRQGLEQASKNWKVY